MNKERIKIWLKAFRLRTLPLSVAGIITGSMLAYSVERFNITLFVLAIATVLFLQILSNLANDLGDGVKGTDNKDRVGPARAIQSGEISVPAMKKAVLIFALLSLLSGIPLAYIGTLGMPFEILLTFIILALACVAAAISYTVGKKAYGYNGMGDVFVFLFFGILSVEGIYVLMTKQFDWIILLPASAIGLLSTAVLNLNNMRDIENDAKSGKNTLVVRMGSQKAKVYHTFLILVPIVLILIFTFITQVFGLLFTLAIYLILLPHLIRVWKTTNPSALDPELKKVALSTFLFSIILTIWVII
jgi:1,4-dihydroxy-2-naphthoate octaprenyltransferase